MLIDVIGNIDSNQLKPSHIIEYKKVVYQLPSNRSKGIYANKNIAEILTMEIPEKRKLAAATIGSNLNKVSTFLAWLARNNYSIADLNLPLIGEAPKTDSDDEQRPPFTQEELTRLFESIQYIQGTHKKASHFWVPLIALFSGARQNEICQLYKSDIRRFEDTDHWYFDINEDSYDKSIKKYSHTRIVPIHKKLISMGFLKYVENVKHERVFPELIYTRDGYAQSVSKWFCRTYLNDKNCNIKTEGSDDAEAVFHSFRHNVITQLDHEHEIPDHHISKIVGQKPSSNSVTVKRYIKKKPFLERQKTVNRLVYPSIDFNKIRPWR